MSKKRFRPQWSFIKSVPGLEAPEGGPVVLVEDGQRLPQEVLVPAALLAVQDNWPYDHQLVVHLLTVEKSSYIKKSCLKLLVCLHYLYYFLKKLSSFTLAGFDLTISSIYNCSSLLGGRRRRYQ
jgi:hypothetical protein